MYKAKIIWIRCIQSLVYPEEFKRLERDNSSQLINQLNLFIDADQILRSGGRCHNSCLEVAVKFPMLLPPTHYLTKLIVLNANRKLNCLQNISIFNMIITFHRGRESQKKGQSYGLKVFFTS